MNTAKLLTHPLRLPSPHPPTWRVPAKPSGLPPRSSRSGPSRSCEPSTNRSPSCAVPRLKPLLRRPPLRDANSSSGWSYQPAMSTMPACTSGSQPTPYVLRWMALAAYYGCLEECGHECGRCGFMVSKGGSRG